MNILKFQLIDEFKITDSDAKDKYKFVTKTLKEKAFKEAISASEKYEANIDISNIKIEDSYTGP